MKKRITLSKSIIGLLFFLCLLIDPCLAHAQNDSIPNSNPLLEVGYCGVSPSYFAGGGIDTSIVNQQNIVGPFGATTFPASAIQTCGHFKIYYEDMTLTYQGGFADPSVGAIRRATLCSVLTYIESVINFNNMASNEYVRILVNKSYCPINNPSPNQTKWYAKARPDFSLNSPGITNGWVYDFITTGNDPANADLFHGELTVNFDQVLFFLDMLPINWQNSTSSVGDCQMDLSSVLLHEFGHVLGFSTLLDHVLPTNSNGGAVNYVPTVSGNNIFTGLDYSTHVGNNAAVVGGTLQKLINAPITAPTLNTNVSNNQSNTLWANNQTPPRNHPIFSGDTYKTDITSIDFPINSYGTHMADQLFGYIARSRVSPGERLEYAMGPFGLQGIERRTFTEPEIDILRNLGNGAMGYQVTTNYLTTNASTLSNTPPYSTKMVGYETLRDWLFSETVAADVAPLVNNINAFVDINVSTDPTNVDPNGNTITIVPGSLINYRGCGSPGGNNHNFISVINNGTTIHYVPKPGFFGRAQFGLNITDGIETGGFVIYTIDVLPGTNVPYTAGTTDMIVNGNYEDGSEVARVGPDEIKVNSILSEYIHEGKLARAAHLSDGHHFSFAANPITYGGGTMIEESFVECLSTTTTSVHTRKGDGFASFPTTGYTSFPYPYNYPSSTAGKRYENFSYPHAFTFYNLKAQMQYCHRYRLEYDAYNPGNQDMSLEVGFANSNTLNWPANEDWWSYMPNLNFSTYSNTNAPTGAWHHIVKEFYYCGSNSDLLFLRNHTQYVSGGLSARLLMDNIKLTEVLNATPSVSITQNNINNCQIELVADLSLVGCNPTFQWQLNGVNISGATASTYTFPAGIVGVYKVIVDDDCNPPYSSTINVIGAPCYQCAYFGTTGSSLGTTLTTQTIPAGNYYITSNTTISGNVTFQDAVVYIGPGVTITVGNNSSLKLDHAHFFGCDQMWNGITLTGTGKFEGINNSLIEDAVLALNMQNNTTSGGLIVNSNDIIFNRNNTAVTVYNIVNPQNYFSFKKTIFTSRDLSTYIGYPFAWPTAASLRSTTGVPGNDFEAKYAVKTYTSVDTKNGSMPQMGIRLYEVGGTTITTGGPVYTEMVIGTPATGNTTTDFNIFDNIRYGIYAELSNFSSVNNVFMLLRAENVTGGGYGINAVNTNNYKYRARIYTPSGSDQPNKFFDCYRAVNVVDYWDVVGQGARIISNKVNSAPVTRGKYGYYINNGSYWNIDIQNNQVFNCETGIQVSTATANNTVQTRNINVNRNTIAPAEGSISITNRSVLQGINVENIFSCTNCTWQTTTVHTDDNTILNVYNGVRVAGFKIQGSASSRNNITLITQGNSNTGQYGVAHAGNIGNWIFANTVAGFGFNSADWVRGSYSDINGNDYVECNTIRNTGRNYEFNGPHTGFTRWFNNDIINGRKGFVLTSTAIGDQLAAKRPGDNRWLTEGTSFSWTGNNYQTYTYSSTPNASRLWVKNNATYKPANNNNSVSNTGMIYDYNGNGNGLGAYVSGGAYQDPCPVQVKTKPVAGGVVLVHAKVALPGNQSIGTWMGQYSLWRSICLDTSLIDTFPELQEFYDLGWQTRFATMSAIDSAFMFGDTALGKSLLANPRLMKPTPLTGSYSVVLFDDDDVNTVIDNYKKFYELYLAYLDSNMTGNDSTQLDSLASLCTTKNGDAVVMARTLYHRVFDDMRIFDNFCEGDAGYDTATTEIGEGEASPGQGQGRYAQGKGELPGIPGLQGTQQYSLHPNPNNGNFSIIQSVRDEQAVEAEIWNAVGARVYKTRLGFTERKTLMKVNGLSNGTYLLKLQDSKGYQYTVKFTIIQ